MDPISLVLFTLWMTALSPNYDEAKAIVAVQNIFEISDGKDALSKYKGQSIPSLSKSGMTAIDFYAAARKLDEAGILFEVTPIQQAKSENQPPPPVIEPTPYRTDNHSVNLTPEERQKIILALMSQGNFEYEGEFPTNFEDVNNAKKLFEGVYEVRQLVADTTYLADLEARVKTKHPDLFTKFASDITKANDKIADAMQMSELNKDGKMLVKQLMGEAAYDRKH